MSGRAFGLFLCFLSNRRLRVVLEGKSSQKYPVNAGVPQDSIFVPTLFLLYITTFLMMVSVIFYLCWWYYILLYLIGENNLSWPLNLNLTYYVMLNLWLIIDMQATLVDVHLNWLNWFPFLILVAGPLVILIGCMIFLSPFLYVIRISTSTVSFLTLLDSGILCLQNTFLWHDLNGFKSRVNRHFFLWALSKQLSYILFIFFL